MDCSPAGSSVHGISQARILKRVVISLSGGASQPSNQACVSCTGRWLLYPWTWNFNSAFPPMTTATWRLLIWPLITGSKPSPFLHSLVPLRSKSNYTSVVFLKGSIHLVTHLWLKILHSVFNKTKFYLILWPFLFLHHSCILFNCYQFSECHIVSSHKFLRSPTGFFYLSIHIQNFPYLVMA